MEGLVIMMKNVSIEEYINALEKNGYAQGIGYYIAIKPEFMHLYTNAELARIEAGDMLPRSTAHVDSACAVGQASLNLETPASSLRVIDSEGKESGAKSYTIDSNDGAELSIPNIVDHLRRLFFL